MTTDGLGINAAVTSDGTVHFWGDGDDGSLQSLVPSSVTGAKIAAISIAGPANGSPEAAVLITKPQPAASTTTVTAPATKYGTAGHVTVKVTATGTTASGKVTLTGAGAAQTATVSSTGTASFTLPRTLRPRSYTVTASYAGNDTTQASTGHTTLRVAKTAPGVPAVKVIKKPTRKKTGKATVTVATRAGLAKATGRVIVTLKLGKKTKHVTGTLRSGRVTVKLPKLTKGKWKLSARYAGNAYYTARTSRTLTIRVR